MDNLKKAWNEFVAKHGPKSGAFLQSLDWGNFQEAIGRKIYRFVINSGGLSRINADSNADLRGSILGLVQIIRMPLPLGKSYLYVPRGPIIISDFPPTGDHPKGDKLQILPFDSARGRDFITELKNLAKNEKAIFVKIEPPIEKKDFDAKTLNPTPYTLNHKSIQPKDTLILNLEKSEEELLSSMHEKTRYNIRLAERKGVIMRWSTKDTLENDLESFWRLAQETAKRDKFSYHPKEYYKKMINNFTFQISDFRLTEKTRFGVCLVIAEKDEEAIAANIVTFFGNTITYLHGASNYARREFMAPHLLQWRTIQEAKRLGYTSYDFWGIAPKTTLYPKPYTLNPKNSWAGITRFKLGFGGEVVNYAPTLDFPISKFWYTLYQTIKNMRL